MNEKLNYQLTRNTKLFPTYCALIWDVLFIWTISTMFFTNVKGLSFSQSVLLDSILMFAGAGICIPLERLFKKLSPLVSTRISLLGYLMFLILCIFGNSFIVFAIAMCCLAFGYVGLGVNGNLILTESLHFLKRDKDYQRIYGKGLSIYYVIEAISSVIVTSIYSINPYLPFWISIGIVSFTEVLSLFFKDTRKIPLQNVELKDKTEKKKTYSYKKIFASVFFISLLVYSFVYRGVLSIVTTNFKIYLQQTIEHNLIPLWLFGILIAGAKLMTAIASKYQFKMNLKFGVRTLIILNVLIVLTFFVNGLACLFNPFTIGTLIIIILTSFVQSMIRVPTQIFINNYLNICMPRESIAKCLSVKTMIEYLGYATVSFAYASMLSGFNDNYGLTNLVYIGTFVFPLVLSMVFFLRLLCKEYAKKYTVIKKEYTED